MIFASTFGSWITPTTVIGKIFGAGVSLSLAAAGSWMTAGAAAALIAVAHTIGTISAPDLTSSSFATSYLKMSAVATALALPFLFAAAVQAVIHSDMAQLIRAAFVQLPLALLSVSLAVPLVSMLLTVTDELSAFVAGGSAQDAGKFLILVAGKFSALSLLDGSTFLTCVLASVAVMAALALLLELMIRAVAVDVVVLLAPLAFAAMVWPARRVWATRTVELLVALILSKFVIVAVLALASATLDQSSNFGDQLSGVALVLMSCFAPWALMKLIPFGELAAGAAQAIHQGGATVLDRAAEPIKAANGAASLADGALAHIPALMSRLKADDQDGSTYPVDVDGGGPAGEDPPESPTGGAGGSSPAPAGGGDGAGLIEPMAAVEPTSRTALGASSGPAPEADAGTGTGTAVGSADDVDVLAGSHSRVATDPAAAAAWGNAPSTLPASAQQPSAQPSGGASESGGADPDQVTADPAQAELLAKLDAGDRKRNTIFGETDQAASADPAAADNDLPRGPLDDLNLHPDTSVEFRLGGEQAAVQLDIAGPEAGAPSDGQAAGGNPAGDER